MAETVVPSVRGVQRILVAVVLVAAAVAAAALAGFALGVAAAPLGAALPEGVRVGAVPALLSAAVVLDGLALVRGRPRPLAVGRQVPRAWGRIFPPALTAALYGARLGVGPLTILSTWQWWAVSVGGALLGVWHAVAVGVAFAAVRLAVVVAVSLWAGWRPDRAVERFRALAARTSQAGRTLTAAAGAALALTLVAGCGGDGDADDPVLAPTTAPVPTEAPPVPDPEPTDPTTTTTTTTGEGGGTTTSGPPPTPTTGGTDAAPPPAPPFDPVALEAVVLDDVPRFTPVPDPAADRALDLAAAAALQPDPTEERPLLETRGFRGGWTRTWRNDTQDVVVATVYDFADAEQAAFYLQDGLLTIGGYGGRFFDVERIPGAQGFRQDGTDEIGPIVTHGVTFTAGNRWYLVYLLGDPATATPDIALDVAARQAAAAGLDVAP